MSKNVENGNFKNRDLDMLDLKQFQDVVNSRILRILTLRKIFGFCFFRTQMRSFNKSAEKTRKQWNFQNPRINYIQDFHANSKCGFRFSESCHFQDCIKLHCSQSSEFLSRMLLLPFQIISNPRNLKIENSLHSVIFCLIG